MKVRYSVMDGDARPLTGGLYLDSPYWCIMNS